MVTKGEEYVDRGEARYEERYREKVVKSLSRKASQLGFQLVPMPETA